MKHILKYVAVVVLGLSLFILPNVAPARAATPCDSIADLAAKLTCLTQYLQQLAAQVATQISGSPTTSAGAQCVSSPEAFGVGSGGSISDPLGGPATVGISGTLNPGTVTASPGSSVSFTVLVSSINNFTGTVKLGVHGLPFGVGAAFTPATVSVASGISSSATLQLCVGDRAPAGTFNIMVGAGVGSQIGLSVLTISKSQTAFAGGSIAQGIQTITPVEIKEIKLLPDARLGYYPPVYPVGDPRAPVGENLYGLGANTLNLSSQGTPGGTPALLTDAAYLRSFAICADTDALCVDQNASRGNYGGPRWFSLADPMNPVIDTSKSWSLDSNVDAFGDYGNALTTSLGVAYGEDGQYSAAKSSQSRIFFFRNATGAEKNILSAGNDFVGVMQSAGTSYFIGNDRILNMTDFGGTQLTSNPSYIPTLPAKSRSVIMGDKIANITFSIPKLDFVATPTLRIYSLTQVAPVAQLVLPVSITSIDLERAKLESFVSPEGFKYAIIIGQPKGTVARASDNNPFENKPVSPMALYMYKLSSAGNTIIPIVEGLKLDGGLVTGVIGISPGGNRALLTFHQLDTQVLSSGYNYPLSTKPHIYILDDLANKNLVRDVYSGPSELYALASAKAFSRTDGTYVYTANNENGNRTYAWKFDTNSLNATTGGTPPPSTCSIAGQTNPHLVATPAGCVSDPSCGTDEPSCLSGGGGGGSCAVAGFTSPHSVYNSVTKTCSAVAGCGATSIECNRHLGCVNNSCQYIQGAGSNTDSCTGLNSSCTPSSSTGEFCRPSGLSVWLPPEFCPNVQ